MTLQAKLASTTVYAAEGVAVGRVYWKLYSLLRVVHQIRVGLPRDVKLWAWRWRQPWIIISLSKGCPARERRLSGCDLSKGLIRLILNKCVVWPPRSSVQSQGYVGYPSREHILLVRLVKFQIIRSGSDEELTNEASGWSYGTICLQGGTQSVKGDNSNSQKDKPGFVYVNESNITGTEPLSPG
jgi:hypothetical protein